MNAESRPRGAAPESSAGRLSDTTEPTASERQDRQLSLADALAERDRAADAAFLSTHPAWMVAAERVLADLAATGQPFNAETITARIGQPPGHRSGVGGLFLRASKRGLIVPAGVTTASRPEARGRLLRQWRGAAA